MVISPLYINPDNIVIKMAVVGSTANFEDIKTIIKNNPENSTIADKKIELQHINDVDESGQYISSAQLELSTLPETDIIVFGNSVDTKQTEIWATRLIITCRAFDVHIPTFLSQPSNL